MQATCSTDSWEPFFISTLGPENPSLSSLQTLRPYHACFTHHRTITQEKSCEQLGGIHDSFTKLKEVSEEQEVNFVVGAPPREDNEDHEVEVENMARYVTPAPPPTAPQVVKRVKVSCCPYGNKRYIGRHKCTSKCWKWKVKTLELGRRLGAPQWCDEHNYFCTHE